MIQRRVRRRFKRPVKRTLLLVAAAGICIGSFLFARALLSPAKAISDQVNTVHIVSGQKMAGATKELPKEYNGKVRKLVYLTFDDGPNPYTEQLLNILKQNNIKATFFMIGANVPGYEESVKRLVREGHYPGLHSMSHKYAHLYTNGQIVKEMMEEQKIIKNITGATPHLTRCPYGSMPGLNQGLRDQMSAAGFKEWDWTIDSLDWKLPGQPNAIINNINTHVRRNIEVILLHEKEQTVQALPRIIQSLVHRGYEFEVYNEDAHFMMNFWHDARL
ncbi:polysaccharide deacetylase family protein [Bacillus sp. 165]|uniref:polysaccharide deacetylase family protein n=1 Tax=Bacillus sp. 165 TaxID=1529117 RepID=UPI001ADA5FB4|nr:polysaccharide deacetylase family protein [Bacillus sp. 165]MBO9130367.1 polysaccharide deacetylase [Bacillus sp. 165]